MRASLRYFNLAAAWLLAALLVGCAAGTPQADTFNKKMAATYITVQTIADATTAGVKAGKISKADGANVAAQANAALQALDVARALYSSDPKAADDKLVATVAILQALQAYLGTLGVSP